MPKFPKRSRARLSGEGRQWELTAALTAIILLLAGMIFAVLTHPGIVEAVHKLLPLGPLKNLVIGSR
jgi:hypothetical protein